MRKLRRTQAISPFGIGAIVDFRREALMHAGLDYWPDGDELSLQEPRLARRLGVQDFRQPPAEAGNEPKRLPFIRFPRWHFCPRCRSLRDVPWNMLRPPQCESTVPRRNGVEPCTKLLPSRRPRVAPLRFVVACESGHIDDFPWIAWAHSRRDVDLRFAKPCASPDLKLMETGTAGLAGLKVVCTACGASRTMLGASNPKALEGIRCTGNRAWLGPRANELCSAPNPPVVLQRGASNLYFPAVVSSILIPPYSDHARQLVDNPVIWGVLATGLVDGVIEPQRLETVAQLKKVPVDDLRRAAEAKLAVASGSTSPESETEYRYAEYGALTRASGERTAGGDDFLATSSNMDDFHPWTRQVIQRVVLVKKLAETRALVGFSRLEPGSAGYTGLVDWSKLAIERRSWLPAVRVYGEGIFVELSEAAIEVWRDAPRWRDLALRANRSVAARGLPPRELDRVFVALHTLAHALIRRLAFECGYGSSSLRERIYYSATRATKMAGVLIYTAAGDAEGTLGGLVGQGRPGFLDNILVRAVRDLMWCSADPICAESAGQGTESLNLAACHACALLPETSCEEGNRLLDRAALLGISDARAPGLLTPFLNALTERLA